MPKIDCEVGAFYDNRQTLLTKIQSKTLALRKASSMKEPAPAKLYVFLHMFNKLDVYMNTKLALHVFSSLIPAKSGFACSDMTV